MRTARISSWLGCVALALTVALGLGVSARAQEDQQDGSYRFLAGSGVHDLGPLCGGIPACPVAATAEEGERVELTGEGVFSLGEMGSEAQGRGSYRITDSGDGLQDVGTWTATTLLDFRPLGGSSSLPPEWSQGVAMIGIEMVSQFDASVRTATMEVGCRLPDPLVPAPPDTIEGIRLDVDQGPNFDTPIDPRATLFIHTASAPDDGDDGDDGENGEPDLPGGPLTGGIVDLQWNFTPLSQPVDGPDRATIGPGIEFPAALLGNVDIDFTATRLVLSFLRDVTFTMAPFNGPHVTDAGGTIAPFSDILFDPTMSTQPAFVGASVVNADEIQVNLAGKMFMAGDQLVFIIVLGGGI